MFCRLCVNECSDFTEIFVNNENEIDIPSLIDSYFTFPVSQDDGKSSIVCQKCLDNLRTFNLFCQSIEEAQKKWQIVLELEEKNVDIQELYFITQSYSEGNEVGEQVLNLNVELKETNLNDLGGKDIYDRLEDNGANEIEINFELEEKYSNHQEGEEASRNELKNEPSIEQCVDKKSDFEENYSNHQEGQEVLKDELENESSIEQCVDTKCDFEEKYSNHQEDEEAAKDELKNESSIEQCVDTLSDKSMLSEQFDSIIAAYSNLSCNECDKPMKSFKILKKHFKIVHKKPGYMICCKRKFFRAANLVDHINLHINPDFFKCEQCDKNFSSRSSLDFHKKTTHVIKKETLSFKCKHCSRKFLTSYVRDNHEETHNTKQSDQPLYFCSLCNKGYPSEKKLKSHNYNVHKVAHSRMCHLCGKTFRGNKALERHQLIHSGVKLKVKCNICEAELSTKGILKAHMIALHPEDTSITYVCNICGKNAPSQRALKNHMDYVHNCPRSHKCQLCDKSFKKPQALTEHLSKHTGDRLYECPHCDKTFKIRSNLHHHRKIKHPKEFEENRGKRIKSK